MNIIFLNPVDRKRILKNIFGQSSDLLTSIVIQLLFIPLMLITWGPKYTGIWLFITSLPSVISFWKLSFSEACRQQIILSGESSKNKIYSISLILTLLVIIITGLFFFSVNLFYLDNFIIFKDTKIDHLNFILVIIFISFSLEILNNNTLVISQYKGKLYIANYIQNGFLLFGKLVVPLSGFFTDKIIFAAFLILLLKILKYVFTKYILYKNEIFFTFKKNLLKKSEIKKIFNKSLKFYYNDVSVILNTSGLIFILGTFFSGEIVAYVTAANSLFRFFVIKLYSIPTRILSYEIPNFFKKNQILKLKNILNLHKKITYLIIVLFLIISFLIGDFVFNTWTSGLFENYENVVFLLICLEVSIYILFSNQLTLGMYLNKLGNITFWSLIITVFTYILIIITLNINLNLENIFILLIIKNLIIYVFYLNFNYNLRKRIFNKIIDNK